MSPEPVTAERTYSRLKESIVKGVIRPGTVLNLPRLSEEYGTSVSPVRDAIHRLVGEKLLELYPGGGFRLPVPTVDGLHHLYRWHDLLIRQAVRTPLDEVQVADLLRRAVADDASHDLADGVSQVFALLATVAGNVEFVTAVSNASERLYLARLHEPVVMKNVAREIRLIVDVAINGTAAAVRDAVWEYHRRRLRRVEKIVAAMII
ncbi:MAG: GntR family transcriptional regulator [Thermomicrobiales bacterium]